MAETANFKPTRRKAGTAPTNAWTRKAYWRLIELSGIRAADRPLPEIDVEAKKLLRALESEIDARDPTLRLRATDAQVRRVAVFRKCLGVPDPAVDGILTKEAAKRFLDEHAWFVPPTDKQVYAATVLASRYGVEVYRERGVMTLGSLSRFLAEYIARAKRHRVADGMPDDGGTRIGGQYGAIQRAAFSGMGIGE